MQENLSSAGFRCGILQLSLTKNRTAALDLSGLAADPPAVIFHN